MPDPNNRDGGTRKGPLPKNNPSCCGGFSEDGACELRVGVRNTVGGFEAHAWVEIGSTVVNDGEDVRKDYPPFDQDIAASCMGAH